MRQIRIEGGDTGGVGRREVVKLEWRQFRHEGDVVDSHAAFLRRFPIVAENHEVETNILFVRERLGEQFTEIEQRPTPLSVIFGFRYCADDGFDVFFTAGHFNGVILVVEVEIEIDLGSRHDAVAETEERKFGRRDGSLHVIKETAVGDVGRQRNLQTLRMGDFVIDVFDVRMPVIIPQRSA